MPSPMRTSLIPAALFALVLPLPAQEAPSLGEPLPLFRSHDPLVLRIEADFDALKDDRDDENEERPGEVYLVQDDGTEVLFPVQIRTRGRFRLQSNTCEFPPLRLNFKKGQLDESLFDGQDKVKLVTHCRNGDRYEQNVVKEYLVYRLYNVLTPLGFQVRMAHITYVDTSGEDDPIERLGFFIEMEETLAERLGGSLIPDEVQATGIHPARITNEHATRVSLFEYMVGNTDFSLYGSLGGAPSPPHNAVPIEREMGGIVPVPYDFDWTGLVNAPYARPDPSLRKRNVRQRVFRGLCRPGVDYPALYASFLSQREALTAVVRDEALLTEDTREEVLEYLDEFWETIQDERDARRRIEEDCRRV
jgi:hypothetical protein